MTSGYFPVPAAMGGAVESIVENIVRVNEIRQELNITVISTYNEEAQKLSDKYKHSEFIFIKTPTAVKLIDKFVYLIAKKTMNGNKNLSYRYIFQRLYYIVKTAYIAKKQDLGKIIIENHPLLFSIFRLFGNQQKYNGKYYFHVHNAVSSLFGNADTISHCKRVIGVSDFTNKALSKELGYTDKNRYKILKNRVDSVAFNKDLPENVIEKIKRKFSIPKDDQIVLYTGRFTADKGVEALLNSIIRIDSIHFSLLVVGGYYYASDVSDQFTASMQKLIQPYENKIHFTGFVKYSEIPELYKIADLVVLPSIAPDAAPLTVVEAITSRKALITTKSGGIPEYVAGTKSIILDQYNNLTENLETSIKEVLSNRNLREDMEDSCTKVSTSWTLDRMYSNLIEILSEA